MARSGDDYLETRKRQIERKKRIFTIVSMISFFGSTLFAIVPLIQRGIQNHARVNPTTSAESSLQEQAKSYALILQKEPNNQVVLEKLSLIRVQLKDFKGAREVVEKLVTLHPDRQDYKVILEDIKKRQQSYK
ncbi:hypothetical protein CLI64_19180 [Nostoc sp. CENA543]|uniref:hypothetical protein n=1 Tax=Nostoc sp. CENA543 TaxID=1869241 RepID=UPI000CA10EF2|nr:hypothetical protein [Nostoc sp. CENA543]AUT02341.1 hypothetical protein CLI64_19180 [Nostoc sp. CENA543]